MQKFSLKRESNVKLGGVIHQEKSDFSQLLIFFYIYNNKFIKCLNRLIYDEKFIDLFEIILYVLENIFLIIFSFLTFFFKNL